MLGNFKMGPKSPEISRKERNSRGKSRNFLKYLNDRASVLFVILVQTPGDCQDFDQTPVTHRTLV